LKGDYWVEERVMLQAEAWRGERIIAQGFALNDVVVGQGRLGRVVRLEARIDGDLLTNYVADALIVATPTGSTAYALAAGGPIMPPQQNNILLVPVAPHSSLDRAVVLAGVASVQIVIHGHSPAAFSLDGEMATQLESGDVVRAWMSPYVARFARVRERDYFYRTLMARLVPKERESAGE
jgi:NAD+ kinase